MKECFRLRPAPSMAVCMLVFHHAAVISAAPLFWNPGGIDGDGIWGTGPGDKNWNDAPGAPLDNVSWPDTGNEVAVFQDTTGGVVTVFEPLLAAGIVQNGADYTINAGVITLVPDSAATNPFINVQGGTLSIDSVLDGSDGLVKTGSGTVVLSGPNSYGGGTSINQGTLNLTGSLADTSLSIASGAILLNQNGGLSNSATLTNAGSLTLNANDTISSYISNGGTLTAGTGTLSATSATLNNGSTVAGLLTAGTLGTLTSNGTVLLSGTATAATTSIQSGTLTLSGSLVSDNVRIASGASLLNQNGGLNTTATLTNAGSLTLNANDTIASYTSNGGTLTAGAGTLFTSGTALNNGSTVAGLLDTGTLTSNGAVLLSGTATVRSSLIESGTLTLSGSLLSNTLGIASGASLLNQNGGLSNNTFLANVGSLTLDLDDTIRHYISNGGTLTAGAGTLFTTNADLNNGSTVAGLLNTSTLTSFGAVLLSGTATAGIASIQSGTLTLSGSLVSDNVRISSGATLLNQNGGLSSSATLTNSGSLTLNANDMIANYISKGGTLTAGAGTLFTTGAALNNGSTVAGLLNTGTLTSNGAVLLSGTATAGSATIQSGVLTLSGTLVTPVLNISSGATMIQNGTMGPGSPSLATTVVTNQGTFIIQQSAVLKTYTSNGGLLDIQNQRMITQNVFLNDGSITRGESFSADLLTTNGNVRIENSALGAQAIVASGALDLVGSLGANSVQIASGASLLNQNGGLRNTATVTNAGSLTLNTDDTIATYISPGGTLTSGAGTLFADNAELMQGSSIAGLLDAETLISRGAVSVTGTITAGTATLQGGTMTLAGSLISDSVTIQGRSQLINVNGGLQATATVDNRGSLLLQADDFISTYISEGGTLEAGAGVLHADVARLNRFAKIDGHLDADNVIMDGDQVRINGELSARSAEIRSGSTILTGVLDSPQLTIRSGAFLANESGGFSGDMVLTNSGRLGLVLDDSITSYLSNGGTLTNGPGTLFTTSAILNDGSTIAGLLDTNTLTSDGSVLVTGTVAADSINIATGTLTNTGTLGNGSTLLNINQGATLAANGIQQYSLLTTSGAGPGTWLGDLDNTANIAPGGLGEIGILAIAGDFSQSAGGTLTLDLSVMDNDRLDITGSATFGGSLELNQLGITPIAPFVPVTVVSASAYAGNITSLTLSENFDGAVFFNPGNGTVTRLELPSGGGDSFFGATRNQTSTWISLYDDVIDADGIADIGNPDLLWALSASFTPDGLNAALLNRLSPEVYGGFSDYAMQATRAHQRSALSAPALAPRTAPKSGLGGSAKSGAKGGIVDHAVPLEWEFFAAVDHFRAGTHNSRNQADYDFDGTGVLAGARTWLRDRTQLGVYLGADWGSVEGALIDADAYGWTFGLIGGHLLDEKSRTRITAGMSYGSYIFDGTRTSASATAAGWSPGKVRFDDVDVDAFDLFVAVDGVAWQQNELTLIPSAGLRYSMSKMDSFNESTGGAPGSPIALEVGRDRHESLLLELGLLARVAVNDDLSLWGEGGVNIGLLDNDRVLAARFAKGSRMMRAEADGLDDDSIYLGCGAIYRINESISAALGYRADIRSGADAQHEVRLSTSWRF